MSSVVQKRIVNNGLHVTNDHAVKPNPCLFLNTQSLSLSLRRHHHFAGRFLRRQAAVSDAVTAVEILISSVFQGAGIVLGCELSVVLLIWCCPIFVTAPRIAGGRKSGRVYRLGKVPSRLKPPSYDSGDVSIASGPIDMHEQVTLLNRELTQ
ncbi:hypothetical protein PIB30_035608 [Stylosanthes scabra]|uniref:Uncharacterized protein n=1 Tax=Stylosanthes scabra TaxID=79078 RepID=A0ABU6XEI8_9FABA|nr:hypothetical protein [Stylosanthes scabra]